MSLAVDHMQDQARAALTAVTSHFPNNRYSHTKTTKRNLYNITIAYLGSTHDKILLFHVIMNTISEKSHN